MTPLKISRRPLKSAFIWYKNAWALLKEQPTGIFICALWVFFIRFAAEADLPLVGQLISVAISVFFAFGMACVCDKIRNRIKATPFDIFAGFKQARRMPLAILSLYITTATLALLLATQFIDGGQFSQLFFGHSTNALSLPELPKSIEGTPEQLQTVLATYQATFQEWLTVNKKLVHAMLAFQGSTFVLSLLFLYAPLFTVSPNVGAPQALALSCAAVFKNILPLFVMFALLIASIFVAYLGLMIVTSIILLIAPAALPLVLFPVFAVVIFSLALAFGMVYTSFHDIVKHSQVALPEQIA
jgi:hypothetical protein